MDSLANNTLITLSAVALVLLAAIAAIAWNAWQSKRLRDRFGPEYDAVVRRLGSRAKAEKELRQREKRVDTFRIVPLSSADIAK